MFQILEAIHKTYKNGTNDLVNSEELEPTLIREILSAHNSWTSNAQELLSINSLKVDKLKRQKVSSFELDFYVKPKISLYFEVTSRGRLSLKWWPTYYEGSNGLEFDFKKRWDPTDGAFFIYPPNNNLFSIKNFRMLNEALYHNCNSEVLADIARSLLRLYRDIYDVLRFHFEIEERNQLVLIESCSPNHTDSRVDGISIIELDNIN